jgi:hypothetical protein
MDAGMRLHALGSAAIILLACGSSPPPATPPPLLQPLAAPAPLAPPPAPRGALCARRAPRYALRLPVPLPGVTGLSDLARDDAGRFWAVEERAPAGSSATTRQIVRLDLSDLTRPRVADRLRFELPSVLDAESLAPLGPDRFALGTEVQPEHASEGSQTSDAVFVVVVASTGPGAARVDASAGWSLDYAQWNRQREVNHGIEGMCATRDWVLMASEQRVGAPPAAVFSPLALRDRRTSSTANGKLWLTHDDRISALTCCEAPDGTLDVMAVQRGLHAGQSTHRLLAFRVATRASGPLEATPDLDVDLEPLYAAAGGVGIMPNLEGLAPLDASSIVMITDDSPREGAQLIVLTAE